MRQFVATILFQDESFKENPDFIDLVDSEDVDGLSELAYLDHNGKMVDTEPELVQEDMDGSGESVNIYMYIDLKRSSPKSMGYIVWSQFFHWL